MDIAKTDFYDENDNVVQRAHITFDCGQLRTIVDWRNKNEEGHPDIREIINYDAPNISLTCVTKSGILELDTFPREQNLKLRSNVNGEIINYNVKDYGFSKLEGLVCDHPGEGHALVRGIGAGGKLEYMMINLGVKDPLSLVFHKFESPVATLPEMHSARYMNYFLLTFTEGANKKYLLLNPGNKEIRLTALAQPYDVTFKATGHSESHKKHFEVVMTIVGETPKTTTVSQFPGKYTDFNEKGYYDLDNLLKFEGPVAKVEVIIPAALKGKVIYNNADAGTESRIKITPPDVTNP